MRARSDAGPDACAAARSQARACSASAESSAKAPEPSGDEVKKNPNASPVSVSDRIRKMCNLPQARFDFDSSQLSSSAKNMLDALATCFDTGAGKGKSINIVGHTDNRGPKDYNRALGHKRAAAVSSYLAGKGMGEDRVNVSSRGEEDATGSDEAGWARDRRVEILLAEDD